MKDKLTKTGHKKPYYRFMSALKGFGFSFLALLALATPVAIAAGVNAAEEARADEIASVSSEEPPVESALTL
ncbi:MAG: hypothetical protein K6E59_01615 [Bacilli bacterium]|nr:hypothetical protein [Bacilli bacterium]